MTDEELRPNVVLAFVDETGREWLAAAIMADPVCDEDHVTVEQMKDRAFVLTSFKIVQRASGGAT
ncbi:MAG TPA: hypothetical protein VIV56_07515 [Gemmatimonadales bacterium]